MQRHHATDGCLPFVFMEKIATERFRNRSSLVNDPTLSVRSEELNETNEIEVSLKMVYIYLHLALANRIAHIISTHNIKYIHTVELNTFIIVYDTS